MKKTKLALFLIAAVIVACIFSPAASAADAADGKEVLNGNYVVVGETKLNFTAFNPALTSQMLFDGTDTQNMFSLNPSTNVNVDSDFVKKDGRYYMVDMSTSPLVPDYQKFCFVIFPSICPLKIVDKDGNEIDDTYSATIGKPIELYIQGKPGSVYSWYVDDGTTSKQTLDPLSRESENPKIKIPYTPENAGSFMITVTNTGSDFQESVTLEISVRNQETESMQSITFYSPSADVHAGLFASGDKILLKGDINPRPGDDIELYVYLYITGINLPSTGTSLKKDGAAYTRVLYDTEKKYWEYYWDTSKFETGTYTIYASLDEPTGNTEQMLNGRRVQSHEYTLSDKSIHVKFAEENGGLFTQGDSVYSFWSARGSPDYVRWYIIGPNFMETGISRSSNEWLYTVDQKVGVDAPQGLYGFSYPRFFSESMEAGTYYLIYQHPGFNDEFDVWPTSGNNYLETNFGESASLEGRPSSNCAEALETLINNVRCDDLCVITDITIEPPYISIDQVEHLEIGEALKIKGTTNYAGKGVTADGTEVKNTFSLKVNRLDFDLAEENAAMQLQIVSRVVPQNIIPYYGERTYEFDEIDTSTWFEGTYQATVTNIDTGFSESIMFTVGGEGFEADSSTLNVPSNPLEEPYEELEPLPPIERHEEPTEPEEPKSPGFILAPLALGLAVILRRK